MKSNNQPKQLDAQQERNTSEHMGKQLNETIINQLYTSLMKNIEQPQQLFWIAESLAPLDTAFFVTEKAQQKGESDKLMCFAFHQANQLAALAQFDRHEHERIFWLHVIGFLSNQNPPKTTSDEFKRITTQTEHLFSFDSFTEEEKKAKTEEVLALPDWAIEKKYWKNPNQKPSKTKQTNQTKTSKEERDKLKKCHEQSLQYQLFVRLLSYPGSMNDLSSKSIKGKNNPKIFWKNLIQFYSFDQAQAIAFFFHYLPRIYPSFKQLGGNKTQYSDFGFLIILIRRFFEITEYSQSLALPYLHSHFFNNENPQHIGYQASISVFLEGEGIRRLQKRSLNNYYDYQKKLISLQGNVGETKKEIQKKISDFIEKSKETKLYLEQSLIFQRNAQNGYDLFTDSGTTDFKAYQEKLVSIFQQKDSKRLIQRLFSGQHFIDTLWFSDGEIAFYTLILVLCTLKQEQLSLFFDANNKMTLSLIQHDQNLLPQDQDFENLFSELNIQNISDLFSVLGWMQEDKATDRYLQFLDFVDLTVSSEIRRASNTDVDFRKKDSPCVQLIQLISDVMPAFAVVTPQALVTSFKQLVSSKDFSSILQSVTIDEIHYPFFLLESVRNRHNSQARIYFFHPFGLEFEDNMLFPHGFMIGSFEQTSNSLCLPFVRYIYTSYLHPLLKMSVHPMTDFLMLQLVKETEQKKLDAERERLIAEEQTNSVRHLIGIEDLLGQLYEYQQAYNQSFIRLTNQLKPGTVGLFSLQKELAWLFKTDGKFYCLVDCDGESRKEAWVQSQYKRLKSGNPFEATRYFSIQVTENSGNKNAFRVQTYHNADQISDQDPSWQMMAKLVSLMAAYQKLEFLLSLLTTSVEADVNYTKRIFWTLKYMLHRPFSPHFIPYQGKKRSAVHLLQLIATFLEVKMARQPHLQISYAVPTGANLSSDMSMIQFSEIQFSGNQPQIIQTFLQQDRLFFNCHWPGIEDPATHPEQLRWQSMAFIENNKRTVDLLVPLYQLALNELVSDREDAQKAVLRHIKIIRLKHHLQIRLECTGLLKSGAFRKHQDAETSGLSGALHRIASCLNVREPEGLNQLPNQNQILEHPFSICVDQLSQQSHIIIQLRAPEWKGIPTLPPLPQRDTNKQQLQATVANKKLPQLGEVGLYLVNGCKDNDDKRLEQVKANIGIPTQAFLEAHQDAFIQWLQQLQTEPVQNSGALLILLHLSAWGPLNQSWKNDLIKINPLWKNRMQILLYSGGSIDSQLYECISNADIKVALLSEKKAEQNLDNLGKTEHARIKWTIQNHLDILRLKAKCEPMALDSQQPLFQTLLHFKVLLEGYLALEEKPQVSFWFQDTQIDLLADTHHEQISIFIKALKNKTLLPSNWQQGDFEAIAEQIDNWLKKLT